MDITERNRSLGARSRTDMTENRQGGSFQDDESILKLVCRNDCTTL